MPAMRPPTYVLPHPFPGCTCPPSYERDTNNGHTESDCPFYGLFGAELRDAHQEAVRIFLAFKSLDSPCTCDPGYIAEGYRHWATCPLSDFTREELEGLGVTT